MSIVILQIECQLIIGQEKIISHNLQRCATPLPPCSLIRAKQQLGNVIAPILSCNVQRRIDVFVLQMNSGLITVQYSRDEIISKTTSHSNMQSCIALVGSTAIL